MGRDGVVGSQVFLLPPGVVAAWGEQIREQINTLGEFDPCSGAVSIRLIRFVTEEWIDLRHTRCLTAHTLGTVYQPEPGCHAGYREAGAGSFSPLAPTQYPIYCTVSLITVQ